MMDHNGSEYKTGTKANKTMDRIWRITVAPAGNVSGHLLNCKQESESACFVAQLQMAKTQRAGLHTCSAAQCAAQCSHGYSQSILEQCSACASSVSSTRARPSSTLCRASHHYSSPRDPHEKTANRWLWKRKTNTPATLSIKLLAEEAKGWAD